MVARHFVPLGRLTKAPLANLCPQRIWSRLPTGQLASYPLRKPPMKFLPLAVIGGFDPTKVPLANLCPQRIWSRLPTGQLASYPLRKPPMKFLPQAVIGGFPPTMSKISCSQQYNSTTRKDKLLNVKSIHSVS